MAPSLMPSARAIELVSATCRRRPSGRCPELRNSGLRWLRFFGAQSASILFQSVHVT